VGKWVKDANVVGYCCFRDTRIGRLQHGTVVETRVSSMVLTENPDPGAVPLIESIRKIPHTDQDETIVGIKLPAWFAHYQVFNVTITLAEVGQHSRKSTRAFGRHLVENLVSSLVRPPLWS
jgi:hypothetical protein